MTQAIITKYFRPTNSRGSRIKAMTSSRGPYVTLPWDYELGQDANYAKAAWELASQLGWLGQWHGAYLDAGSRVYVRALADGHEFTAHERRPQCRTVAARCP